jgi:hypothetical protein
MIVSLCPWFDIQFDRDRCEVLHAIAARPIVAPTMAKQKSNRQ